MAGKKKKQRSTMRQLVLTARAGRTALSQRLSEIDVYPGQDAVLLALAEEDGVALRDLAEKLAVRPPTVTKTITRLAAQGLVEKRVSAEDARQSRAYLTEAGQSLVGKVRAAQEEVEEAALQDLSSKERKALRKLLRRIERSLGEASSSDETENDE
ncbi:MarR family winged helix-turn-helix transcriptional regulator [Consotaella salsifontis]|uniref:DNA-binding transcriptional regulator, MarR family n=1 Tax=Consotaella salsifontis TaxID=1365950 RepID=A0A1T4NK77_9HYPH|nr:MarR family transcriptional regulator [Consotaella salsifontis]SJZ79543.1 DNA-binding transcriptional regulator, MarR family [Consotaella salsifontis]